MLILVWLCLIISGGLLLLSSFKVTAAKVDLQSLGLLFWLLAIICMRLG